MDQRNTKYICWDRKDKKTKPVTALDFSQWFVSTGYNKGERNSFNNEATDRHLLMESLNIEDSKLDNIYNNCILISNPLSSSFKYLIRKVEISECLKFPICIFKFVNLTNGKYRLDQISFSEQRNDFVEFILNSTINSSGSNLFEYLYKSKIILESDSLKQLNLSSGEEEEIKNIMQKNLLYSALYNHLREYDYLQIDDSSYSIIADEDNKKGIVNYDAIVLQPEYNHIDPIKLINNGYAFICKKDDKPNYDLFYKTKESYIYVTNMTLSSIHARLLAIDK